MVGHTSSEIYIYDKRAESLYAYSYAEEKVTKTAKITRRDNCSYVIRNNADLLVIYENGVCEVFDADTFEYK